MEKFQERVQSAPDTRPLKLKVGQSLEEGHPLQPVRQISDALNNIDRIAYYRRKIICDSHITTKLARQHCDDFIIGIRNFQDDHPDFIQRVDFAKKEVIIMQTKWMRIQLGDLTRDSCRNNLGTLTDTTYKYFRNGFLMTSSIYCIALKRWIPILLSFIGRENEGNMKEHFIYLIECLQTDMLPQHFEAALDHVVDFSTAEHNGFVKAYVDVKMRARRAMEPSMSEGIRIANERELATKAETHLKGCLEHFRYTFLYNLTLHLKSKFYPHMF
jgi:hypothetical protein